MTDKIYAPTADFTAKSHADRARYDEMYAASIDNPDAFWGEHGKRIDWMTPYTKVRNASFKHGSVSIKWYEDGGLNIAANCIDRHLKDRGTQTAIIWEPDDPRTKPSTSPMSNCTPMSARWPMCSSIWACRRVTGSSSTCR